MMKKTATLIGIFILAVTLAAGMIWSPPAQASEPFLAQIVMFGGNFAPRGWALCDGQLLQIAQNTALFSLLGTTYGGDGRTTFGLPDLRGRVAMHPGTGPGLSNYRLGQKGGVEQVTLNINQIPSHTHEAKAYSGQGNQQGPGGNVLAFDRRETQYSNETPDVDMSVGSAVGGSQPHTNMQPYLGINHIIALVGMYPSRT
ncbi:MAG: phage tail protein [Desulfobacteraceae bacterium]|nr:phage tail protein [Desulfobacteraceae bacterium]